MHQNIVENSETATVVEDQTFSFDEFIELAIWFHNYPAPGLLLGGYMVDIAKSHMPEGVLYDAVSETAWCLPDAIQMLTPCTIGNGWLRVTSMGVYALSLFDKFTGEGVRVSLDPAKTVKWENTHIWLMKTKTKPDQNSEILRQEIREHGPEMLTIEKIQIKPEVLNKRNKGVIGLCPICGDAYPVAHGGICRGCSGDSPYLDRVVKRRDVVPAVGAKSTPIEESVGKPVLHDMTRVVPGKSKGVAFTRGHVVTAGDVCRLQQMGRFNLYVEQDAPEGFIHEDDAAEAFAGAMAGIGVTPEAKPREGRVNMVADTDGIVVVNERLLEAFNSLPNVMAASRHGYSLVREGRRVAATRAIPLFLDQSTFELAFGMIASEPLFSVRPLRRAKIGLLITGNEVFKGLVEEKFAEVIEAKVKQYGCSIVETLVRPDNATKIAEAIRQLVDKGCDLVITTAGLSVDPDDVTRQGLLDAGLQDMQYGIPVLPGAMTLVGKIGSVRVLGVPACALYHKTTSLDLLLPRLLADLPIERADLAKFGNGGMCMECTTCTYPKCPFGR
ncbi:MAG: trehalose-binding protein [Pseudodesulfovibrio sp.]|nr:trehalose-binding protein [Pseudodesulfovibrio sp.]